MTLFQRVLCASAVLVTLVATVVSPAAAQPTVAAHPPVARVEASAAREALRRAEDLLGLGRTRPTTVRPGGGLGTLVMRDLALRIGDLDGAARARARRLLARPTQLPGAAIAYTVPSDAECSPHLCVHWVDSTKDAPPLVDVDGSGVPDWVERNLEVLEWAWKVEMSDFGYRPPLSDLASADHGPDARVDVYLADLGDQGLFGYCAPEDAGILGDLRTTHQASGHCVLDNDYRAGQFPGSAGLRGLQATAPHELFHLVQFGYDVMEDTWFMESTATWIEDEVFDSVDQNRDYLRYGSMHLGGLPLDDGARDSLAMYGNWGFIRFLSEYFGSGGVADPTIVRRAWEFADASRGAPDEYSILAIVSAVLEQGVDLRTIFAEYGVENLLPERFYEEGATYPTPMIDRTFRLSAARTDSGWRVVSSLHLTNSYVAFVPAPDLARASRLDLSATPSDASAELEMTAVVFLRSGKVRSIPLDPDASTVPFGPGTVARVVLVFTNASTRYTCRVGTEFACSGEAMGDGLGATYRATVR